MLNFIKMTNSNSIFHKDLSPLLKIILFSILCPLLIYMGVKIIHSGVFYYKGQAWQGFTAYSAGFTCLLWSVFILSSTPKVYFNSNRFNKSQFLVFILSASVTFLTVIQMFIGSLKLIIDYF